MEQFEGRKILTEKLSALLEEYLDSIKPTKDCGNPECDVDHDCPDGPWMISGWAMGVDLTAESEEESIDEVETWTITLRSKGLPRTQCLGLGVTISNSAGA